MKKVILGVVALSFLVACSNTTSTPSTTDSTKTDSVKVVVDSAKVDSTKK